MSVSRSRIISVVLLSTVLLWSPSTDEATTGT